MESRALPSYNSCNEAEKIGFEYIVEAEGEGFISNKIYFVCLLCEKTEENGKLDWHLRSQDHHLKFLVITASF